MSIMSVVKATIVLSIVVDTMLIARAQGDVPSIMTSDNGDVMIQMGSSGDMKWRAGTTEDYFSMAKLQQTMAEMQQNISDLQNTIANMQATLPDAVNNIVNRNSTVYTYTSNMNPAYAASVPLVNSLQINLGQFSVNSVIRISVQDQGYCSGYGLDFTIVGRWGVHFVGTDPTRLPGWVDDPSIFHPEVFTHGGPNGAGLTNTRFFFKPKDANTYYLYLYIPPWPICGASADGDAPQTHRAVVTMQLSDMQGSDFNPAGAPVFNFATADTNGFVEVPKQVTVTDSTLSDMVDDKYHTKELVYKYTSNLRPDQLTIANSTNDLRQVVGQFSTTSVLELTIQDAGWCANFGMSYTIVGMWGVHLSPTGEPDRHHPEVFTFGSANEYYSKNIFQLYFKPVSATQYLLYLYIPPWPVCGSDGTTPREHTVTVAIKASADGSSNYNPTNPAPFDYFTGNTSNLTALDVQVAEPRTEEQLTTMINGAINRNQKIVTWTSNMNQTWADANGYNNSFGQNLGLFSVNTAIKVTVQDEGRCSGTAMTFTVVGRWGTHWAGNVTLQPSWLTDPSIYYPVVYTFGGAGGLWAANLFNFYFASVPGKAHQYYLYMYIPPFPICGTSGTTPSNHRTVITMEASEQRGNDFNPVGAPVFDKDVSTFVKMPTRIADPATSPQIQDNVNKFLNRNRTVTTWNSNLDPLTYDIHGPQNSLTHLVGQFSTSSVLNVQVQDMGWCSGFGMDFTIVGRWGIHYVSSRPGSGDTYHPEVFSYGSAAEWLSQRFQWYASARDTDSYYLWLHVPAFPVCGSSTDGSVPRLHTTTITTQVSGDFENEYTPVAAPTFDYFGANASNAFRLAVQLTA